MSELAAPQADPAAPLPKYSPSAHFPTTNRIARQRRSNPDVPPANPRVRQILEDHREKQNNRCQIHGEIDAHGERRAAGQRPLE